jgi:hypothetical protein
MLFKLEFSNLEGISAQSVSLISVVGLPLSNDVQKILSSRASRCRCWSLRFQTMNRLLLCFEFDFLSARRPIELAARLSRARGAAIRFITSNSVRIDIRHDPSAVAQCTVNCLPTGRAVREEASV